MENLLVFPRAYIVYKLDFAEDDMQAGDKIVQLGEKLVSSVVVSEGVSDSYYPGWKAFIDGEPTKAYRTNLAFRGVLFPSGNHTVSFLYQPDSYLIGFLISGVTLASLTAYFIYRLLRYNIKHG